MYRDHVPVIAKAMHLDIATFKRGVMFAALSARTPFNRVPSQCRELSRLGDKAQCLWSWKFDAYIYVETYGEILHRAVTTAKNTRNALYAITRVPGMGIVKGAFVLQLMGHDIACIDVRNIQRDGRQPRAYRSDGESKKSTPAFWRKIDRYILDTGGRAEHYWDVWCNEVGPDYGMTGEQCSALHLTTIVHKRLRDSGTAQSGVTLDQTF